MSVRYAIGDATKPEGTGPRVIVHVCNDIRAWGKGFVLALSKRWKEPERQFRAWTDAKLGDVQFVEVEPHVWVANLIGQHGIAKRAGQKPIRYDAVAEGLRKVAAFALHQGATVHMPRIGTGLAGGSWDEIEPVIRRELSDRGVDVVVYDLAR
jgi:O-acetyl-ADP-ribose deacetylase (regulator of RNase III)